MSTTHGLPYRLPFVLHDSEAANAGTPETVPASIALMKKVKARQAMQLLQRAVGDGAIDLANPVTIRFRWIEERQERERGMATCYALLVEEVQDGLAG